MASIKSKGSNFSDLSKATDEFFAIAQGKKLNQEEDEQDIVEEDNNSSLSEDSAGQNG